jgi:hypothetical protein
MLMKMKLTNRNAIKIKLGKFWSKRCSRIVLEFQDKHMNLLGEKTLYSMHCRSYLCPHFHQSLLAFLKLNIMGMNESLCY